MNKDLVTISRLALSGSEVDLRLFLAKHIRKIKKDDIDTAIALEELLKYPSSTSPSILRKKNLSDSTMAMGQQEKNNLDEEVASLLKIWNPNTILENIYLSPDIQIPLELIVKERSEENLKILTAKGLKPITTAIFQGPPGVGKSLAAKWLSKRLNLPLYILDLTAVMSSYMGKTGNNLRKVLDFAKTHPCVIFLDEIDAIAKKRGDNSDVGELKRLVTILLQELDDWPTQGLLLGATNHFELIDPALWRRFDMDLSFNLPTNKNIEIAIKDYLADDFDYFLPWLDLIKLKMQGLSFSLIKREISYLRKLKLMDQKLFEKTIIKELLPNTSTMSKQEKIKLALQLVNEYNFPKIKAAELMGISRDTLRKYLNDNIERV
ncbi:AAA family ATPase [Acinetobacter baumannii]|uniref:AAA domain family protein n=1 Tax=Acinetobacter baumannii 99063 TaxID=1310630 RepID=A0A009SCG9_ACIBA|nr:ATP-binding protein [Acinetobacter baumannii]EXC51402.1 AAA domain family protein [Acinetobacter baumannii 99063]MCZ2976072.1 ATP-binding protein [Acinetobacter baumannii]MCZ3132212.1 ATP-binding protein [Acinetobacter baumannii]MDK1595475.1 ATP-binding protein [Acinetobacter baumannii]MDO3669251.1 ATP-binding protein [Acinetobacter baumannii]